MASISSLSSSTNSALGSLRGYGGLASGLDRDTLIEGMTAGTQTKVNKQEQAKTKLQWQMDAFRELSDKMISFADKYTSTMTSKTNLFSDVLWAAASTTVNGVNNKYVSVSGASTAASNVSIAAIKQLAKNASISNNSFVSDRTLKTEGIDTGNVEMSTLGGKSIEVSIGNKSFTLSIPYGQGELTDAESVAKAINEAAGKINVQLGNEKHKLSEFIAAEQDADGNLILKSDTGLGNSVKITGGSALAQMGIKKDTELKPGEPQLVAKQNLSQTQDFATRMGNKDLTFNYNGSSKTITMPTANQIRYAYSNGSSIVDKNGNILDKDGNIVKDADGNALQLGSVGSDGTIYGKDGKVVATGEKASVRSEEAQLDYVKDAMQQQLDTAFGKGRIKVGLTPVDASDTNSKKQLTFKTMTPGSDKADDSSTLSITSGSAALLGSHGGLGIAKGESNRINLSASLEKSGLNIGTPSTDGKYEININGTSISFTKDDTVNDIMKKINNSDAGVTISYMSTADKFMLTANEGGAAGNIKLSGNGADLFFGAGADGLDTSDENTFKGNSNISAAAGQDAIISVKYAGSDQEIDLVRGSNNFNLEGLNVALKGTFGYDESGNRIKDTEEITFTSNVDTEKIVSTISDLVKEYNEIVEWVNKEMSARPDKDYFPLTADQKSEMSEKEIELWEEKAKEGVLYGSSELRSLASDLRFTLSAFDQYNMADLGLSVSSSWSDNGKLVLDENKLKAALETDLDGVREAFTSGFAGDGNGFATNLKNTFNKYVGLYGDSKGVLIEKAGSTKSPTSVLNNSILSEMNDIDKILNTLKERLKSEQDRYIKQFTQLETLISQMNSQSSYLSGMGF